MQLFLANVGYSRRNLLCPNLLKLVLQRLRRTSFITKTRKCERPKIRTDTAVEAASSCFRTFVFS